MYILLFPHIPRSGALLCEGPCNQHAGVAGEWFCPRCRSELELDSSDQPIHTSLVPTRLMKQEDCYRRLAAALGGFQVVLTSAWLRFGT